MKDFKVLLSEMEVIETKETQKVVKAFWDASANLMRLLDGNEKKQFKKVLGDIDEILSMTDLREAKLQWLTEATKAVAMRKYRGQTFVIQKHTEDYLAGLSKHDLKHAGDFSWDISDSVTPDLKTSFPISGMQDYDDRTTAINVSRAIKDILAGKWNPA